MMRMYRFFQRLFFAAVTAAVLFIPAPRAGQEQQKPKKKEKSVRKDILNFDGGIFFQTEGSLSDLTCFRLAGRGPPPDFFVNFKRLHYQPRAGYPRRPGILTQC